MTSWMLALLGLTLCLTRVAFAERNFTVDYKNNTFLKDGEPFRYVSGSVHYFRVPKPYWKDRLHKLRMAGLNAVQTYVEWSGHEPEPGKYNFEGDYDLKTFLKTAQDVGLLVILRPGPYICAERDNGGLPYWLLRQNPNMRYRTSDKTYLAAVDRWLSILLPIVKPFLYNNGGPIITVQVENEYGQYGACDHAYMQHLVDTFRSNLGENVTLFRNDAPSEVAYKCDAVNHTLVTADFGPGVDVNKTLQLVRDAQGPGPLVVTEYYPGWLDSWGKPLFHANDTAVLGTFEEILEHNASVNLYVFHGGTNFGFTSGSDPPPQITSYDFGAPLSEAGDPTELYFKIRNITGKYLPLPEGQLPRPSRKLRLGKVHMTCGPSLDDVMSYFRRKGALKRATSEYPITFEELGQDGGYVIYTTTVGFQPNSPALLSVPGIKNRGYVYTKFTKAVLSSDQLIISVPVVVEKGETLKIIVENTGRINFGVLNHDRKGILGNVTLDGKVLTNWTMEAVPIPRNGESTELFDMLEEVDPRNEGDCAPPRVYFGKFRLRWHERALDTFLDPTGWTKGVAFLNGFNLGRYWPVVGPQVTLYVPGTLIRRRWRRNLVVLLEMEGANPSYWKTVKFVSEPNIDGPTPDE
ncbi:beta-galactosidase-like [Ornithodoros turicata]|uniref:beta-galactosidase-like n=1 Tax=Ornithodoros turicata TaxID=34597 RepID=UPI00313A4386